MKIKKTVLIIICLIILAGIILSKELNDLDEIWNYNFARCIADGLLPYKDFNMVQTPLLPIICGLVLKITYNELIVMRLLAIALMFIIFTTIYKIFKTLEIKNEFILSFVVLIFILFKRYLCIDYNFTNLLIVLILIYLELNRIKKNRLFDYGFKYDFIVGIIAAISILFKHTTGFVLTIICLNYKLLLVNNMDDFKHFIKVLFTRILGALIPITFFLTYLFANNIFNDFIDYTIYSINTFSNKIPYTELIKGRYGIHLAIFSILVPISILVMYFKSVVKNDITKEQQNTFILFAYSVASFTLVYPISDGIHFLIGSLPAIIYIGYYIFIKYIKTLGNKKISNYITAFIKVYFTIIIMLLFITSIFSLINYLRTASLFKDLTHFKYIKCVNSSIKEIDEYILDKYKEGKSVYILDARAAIYMIPINKYNKDYDMFLKGNLGSKGEEGIIKKLKNENENTIILILNDKYMRNWQTPETVIDYIKSSWNKTNEILLFDTYIK